MPLHVFTHDVYLHEFVIKSEQAVVRKRLVYVYHMSCLERLEDYAIEEDGLI